MSSSTSGSANRWIQPHAVRDDLRRIPVTLVRHLAHDGPSGCVSTPRSSASAAPLTNLTVPQKRHRAAARARDVRNRSAPRPGSPRLRQLPPAQPDSLRTPGPRRSCRCCTHRRWSRRGRPLSGGGAARRHSADCPDDACPCHGRWTDRRTRPGALRRGDRGRRAGGSDRGGQRRLRGPADGADRVPSPRAGRRAPRPGSRTTRGSRSASPGTNSRAGRCNRRSGWAPRSS